MSDDTVFADGADDPRTFGVPRCEGCGVLIEQGDYSVRLPEGLFCEACTTSPFDPEVEGPRTHRADCPGLAAWDIPGACNCDRPTVAEVVREGEERYELEGLRRQEDAVGDDALEAMRERVSAKGRR